MNVVNLEWLSEFWGYVVGGGANLPDHPWCGLDPDDEARVVTFAREGVKLAFQDLPPLRRRRFAASMRYATDYLSEEELERYLMGVLPPFKAPRDPRAFYRTVLRETFGGGPEGPFEVYDNLNFRIYHPTPPGPPLATRRSTGSADHLSHQRAGAVTGETPAARGAAELDGVAVLYQKVVNALRGRLPDAPVETRLRAQLARAAQLGVPAAEHLDFLLESLIDDPHVSPEHLLTLLEEDMTETAGSGVERGHTPPR